MPVETRTYSRYLACALLSVEPRREPSEAINIVSMSAGNEIRDEKQVEEICSRWWSGGFSEGHRAEIHKYGGSRLLLLSIHSAHL